MVQSIRWSGGRWLTLAGLCCCLCMTVCGGDSTPAPVGSDSPPVSAGALYVLWEQSPYTAGEGKLWSYRIDSNTGRLTLAGTEQPPSYGQLVTEPLWRYVYLVNNLTISTYSIDPTSRRLVPSSSIPMPTSWSKIATPLDEAKASARYLYVTAHQFVGRRREYRLATFEIGDGGSLRQVAEQRLGTDDHAEGSIEIAPDGKVVYLWNRGLGSEPTLTASTVEPDGSLAETSILGLGMDRSRENGYPFFQVRGVLVAMMGSDSGPAVLATVTFDRARLGLESRAMIKMPSGLVHQLGDDAFVIRGVDHPTSYAVGASGEISLRGEVPDPEGHYSSHEQIDYHPSWRFAYIVQSNQIRSLTVAPSGQLTLIEDTPLPDVIGAPTAHTSTAVTGK